MASHYFGSHKGGVEIVAEELFRRFAERGDDVIWLAGDSTRPPEPTGGSRAVPLRVLNFVESKVGLPFPIPLPNGIRKIVREVRNSDLLVLHDCLYLTNILAFWVARLHGKPTVIVQHTRFFPNGSRLENAIIRLATLVLTRPMLAGAAQVVFVSETSKSYFDRLPFRKPPVVIFNGVNTDLFRMRRADETSSDIRRGHGLDEEGTVILFVGRFVEKKGIAVMKKLAEQRPDWTWVFAGWGPLDPAKWKAPNVRVFSHLQGESMAALYRACDLLVLPSTGEGGFPLVLLEALACGLPAVCGEETRAANPTVGALVRGARVFAGDDDKTASVFLTAIEESLEFDAASAANAGERRAFVASHCSWERVNDRYLEVLSRLAPEAAAPVPGLRRAPEVNPQ